jgi:hypothetical protein
VLSFAPTYSMYPEYARDTHSESCTAPLSDRRGTRTYAVVSMQMIMISMQMTMISMQMIMISMQMIMVSRRTTSDCRPYGIGLQVYGIGLQVYALLPYSATFGVS